MTNATPKKREEALAVIIDKNLADAIYSYLTTKPFNEVAGLANGIQHSSIIVPVKMLEDTGVIKSQAPQAESTGAVKEVILPEEEKEEK